MKQSELFTKTTKTIPADEISKNAQLLIQAGFIYKEMAGVYTFLPLGLKVIEKISNIIQEEMNKIGGIQMKSTALQKKEIWEKTNRWSDEVTDNWFKTKLKNGTELGLAFTHEEAFSDMIKNYISSYKDLPIFPYDIRTIFRNELRSKSGILRGREFSWKALYSFSIDEKQHSEFYEKAKNSYNLIYKRVGLGDVTYLTFASGGTFSKFSHEFQTIFEFGEDTIYIDKKKNIAINKEVYNDETLEKLNLIKSDLIEKKAVEVGNIFTLGYKFSEPLNLKFKNKEGESLPVFMGSYGIGITRLMGIIVEIFNDEKGIIWPESVAPFQIYLINIGMEKETEIIYKKMIDKNIEVLWDDRKEKRVGEKFADADLIGIPYRLIISDNSLKKGGFEIKKRNEIDSKIISEEDFFKIMLK